MKILKASAGSGKTYRLSKTYRDILLNSNDPYAYRHVLAVTFTNKATSEMKSRILKDLKKDDNPRAARILTSILHDYSAFAVSTIDKFFQRTLKAFSREIGHFAGYQIELDRKSVISEAMDRILDSVTESDNVLLPWIRETVRECLESGEKPNLEKRLYTMGCLLKSEEHRQLLEENGWKDSELYSKERLSAVRKECRRIISDFESACSKLGLAPEKGRHLGMPTKTFLKNNPEISALFDESFDIYSTAVTVDSLVFSLGLAREFYSRFDEILREKNLMCLDESNTILRDIINGSDAPFVYEKLGVRYRDFLLDEFQDTSEIQWENFLPLLRESEAGSEAGPSGNLIVGDVKQSIYRWRNSDWRLLGERVEREFPGTVPEPMQDNWRSCRAIIDFNNDLFTFLAPHAGVSGMYSDVRQTVRARDPQKGEVRVSFCDDQCAAVTESIKSVRERGASYADIAVLVRSNAEGKIIADALVGEGIPVISNDSLSLKSSVTVRRLVSLLSNIGNPGNLVNSFLSSSLNVTIPESRNSLLDLCEALLRELRRSDPETVSRETLYIQSFEDEVQSWAGINGNDLGGFLKYWDEGRFFLTSPDSKDAVTVITVHKSKGLQFPHVIFPYAESVTRYKHGVHWCVLKTEGTKLPPALEGLYPVDLSEKSARSYFAADYEKERAMQDADNINVLYVALTRAEKSLNIIAKTPPKTTFDSVKAGKVEFKNYSQAIFAFCNGNTETTFGEPYDFSKMERGDGDCIEPRPVEYSSFELGDRLKPSEDATDFFGEDGSVGIEASGRLKGVALHRILSSVNVPSDLEKAVSLSVLSGELTQEQGRDALGLLSERIASHPGWFCSAGRNEVSVIDGCGNVFRPDRVVVSGDRITVIDYKFGSPKDSYRRQVGKYVSLYRKMGYSDVQGYIWYVQTDTVERP